MENVKYYAIVDIAKRFGKHVTGIRRIIDKLGIKIKKVNKRMCISEVDLEILKQYKHIRKTEYKKDSKTPEELETLKRLINDESYIKSRLNYFAHIITEKLIQDMRGK